MGKCVRLLHFRVLIDRPMTMKCYIQVIKHKEKTTSINNRKFNRETIRLVTSVLLNII